MCPGYVRTALVESQISTKAQADNIYLEDAAALILAEKQPSGGFIAPSDVGAMVVYLCSDVSAQITGSVFTIDGGWTAQ